MTRHALEFAPASGIVAASSAMNLRIHLRLVFWMMLLLVSLDLASQIEPKDRLFETRLPFAFSVGDNFRPGTYIFSHLGPQAILIEKDDASATGILLVETQPLPQHKNVYPGLLIFNNYGEHRFLSQIWTVADSQIHHARKYEAERKLLAAVRPTLVCIRGTR
jgi:hypothetical protein